MSRYDGLIIPRSYSEYINKTDAATLQQALQLPGVLSGAVAAGDNKAVTSNAVNDALDNYTVDGSSPTFQDVIINGNLNLNVTHTDTYINIRYYNYYRTDLVSNDTSSVIYIYNPMLSEGNKEIPWTPAPEDQQEIINTTVESMSEIKQTADTITSTVKNISKGGSNILLNTRFEGAKPGGNICPEWGFHNGMHIYVNQGKKNYNKENTIYLGNSQNSVRGVLAQDISVNKVPKGTTVTLSFDIMAENNVQGWGVGFDYYNSSWTHLKGQTLFKASSGNGHKSITLTTPTDIDYEYMQFYVYHEGSNNGASGYLVVIGNIMLEKGDVETVWQPSYYELVNKSMVTQTANEIKYEFQQGGGFPNLVPNGAPTQTNDNTWWYWNATKYTGDNNYTELGFYSNNTSDNNCCLGSAWMVVSPGKTYSISFWAYCEPNVVNPYVVAKCTDSNFNNYQYPSLCELKLGDPNGTKWYKYKINWTAPSGITRMQLCFHQRNHTQNVNYVTRIDQVMVIEGRDIFPTKWYPKFQEIESNTIFDNENNRNKHTCNI